MNAESDTSPLTLWALCALVLAALACVAATVLGCVGVLPAACAFCVFPAGFLGWGSFCEIERYMEVCMLTGTVKVGHHDPDNVLCACGICEASGRWIKRPLPVVPHPDVGHWLRDVQADDVLSAADRGRVASYFAGTIDTAEFLRTMSTPQPVSHPDDVRAAIEHLYRTTNEQMPNCAQRISEATLLTERGWRATFIYDDTTGSGHYELERP